jgi:hypothetical protein
MLNASNAGPALEPRLRVHPRKSLAEGFEDGTDADMAPEPLAGIAYHDDGTTAWVDEVAAARFLASGRTRRGALPAALIGCRLAGVR